MHALAYRIDSLAGTVTSSTSLELLMGQTLSISLKDGGHWYGHGFNHNQPYPLESTYVHNNHFAVNNIQCPIWLASEGYVILADTKSPLDVSINHDNSGSFTLSALTETVTIRIFKGTTLPEAHAQAMDYLGTYTHAPQADLLGDSFFCTWTQYPRCINQERILDMARQIRKNGYPTTRLIIDDRWESCFGELTFAKDFPDPKKMFDELHSLGFQVWLWVTPFVNQEAKDFAGLAAKKIIVPRKDGAGAALMRWWGGTAGLVDLTNPEGRKWYRAKLEALQTLGADGFKIDGGDYKYQPAADIAAWHEFKGESGYSDELLSFFEELVPGNCETRASWLSQRRNILWREGGKDSHWGLDNGLHAMVTLGLHLSLMGHDIFIPDMVPGRVQTMISDCPLPTDELMIRWTQASTLMPMVQFSYYPWNYEAKTNEIVLAYAKLHKALQPYLAQHSQNRTAPLLRPIWYGSPSEKYLYTVDDEWLLGPDLLIAPVVQTTITNRTVTLPQGKWIDAWTLEKHNGGIENYEAPYYKIPLFVREENNDLLKTIHNAVRQIPTHDISHRTISATHKAGLDRDLSVTG